MLIRPLYREYSNHVKVILLDWGFEEIIDSYSNETNNQVQEEFLCKSFVKDDSVIRCALQIAAIYMEAGQRREIAKSFYEKLLNIVIMSDEDKLKKGVH